LIGAFFPSEKGFDLDKTGTDLALTLKIFRACSANIETLFENFVGCHYGGSRQDVPDGPKDRFCQI
jgi:hypothetical protein